MKRPEQDLQIRMIKVVKSAFPELDGLIFHNPNGANQGKAMGGILKAMGRIPGVPDLTLIWKGTTYWIEVKTEDGKVSPEQKTLHAKWNEEGVFVVLVRSEIELVDCIEAITGLKSKVIFAKWQREMK